MRIMKNTITVLLAVISLSSMSLAVKPAPTVNLTSESGGRYYVKKINMHASNEAECRIWFESCSNCTKGSGVKEGYALFTKDNWGGESFNRVLSVLLSAKASNAPVFIRTLDDGRCYYVSVI